MADIHLGRYNLKSHGFTVARFHMYDWIIFVVLVLIEVALNVIEPFHRFVGAGNAELIYPLKENTVPVWAVPLFAVVLPIVIFVGIYIKRNDVFDMHNAILGLLYSVLITGVITDAIKDAVGRPRPNFYKRCFPNGKQTFDSLGDVICTGLKDVIKEGYKSFPSGHTSWSFAGLGFTSWYLAGKLRAFDRKGHIAKLCIIFAPLLGATLVAISRIDDYWHHWTDVFAGGLIGLTVASFCYLQFFPWPSDRDGWGPHEYFNALNQSQRNPIVNSDTSQIRASSSKSLMSDIELGSDNIHHESG